MICFLFRVANSGSSMIADARQIAIGSQGKVGAGLRTGVIKSPTGAGTCRHFHRTGSHERHRISMIPRKGVSEISLPAQGNATLRHQGQ
jgi:hypothetical protein